MPEILAGVRIAFTTTVGLATLAFFAGGGGLGKQIYTESAGTGGIFFKSNVVVAGGMAVLLAAVGDLVILGVQHYALPWRRAVRMITPLLAAAKSVNCPPAPRDFGAFHDAFNFILHSRESISGGVCIGGWTTSLPWRSSTWRSRSSRSLVAVLVAVPIGLYLGHKGRGEFLAISVSNVGRAVPSLALLAFFVAFVGLGFVNVVLVLTLLGIPPILTNTFVGVRQVDRETVDAARGVGLTEAEIVRKVELPLALPTIFAGLRTSAVAIVATATITPLANVESLGNPILEPQTYGDAGQLGAAILIALITLATDAGIGALQRAFTPKGLTVGEHAVRPARRFLRPLPTRSEST